MFILTSGDGVVAVYCRGARKVRGLHWGEPSRPTLAGSRVGTFDATRRRRDVSRSDPARKFAPAASGSERSRRGARAREPNPKLGGGDRPARFEDS